MIEQTIDRVHQQFRDGSVAPAEVASLARWVLDRAAEHHSRPETLFKYSRICHLATQPASDPAGALERWCAVLEVSNWYCRWVERASAEGLAALQQALVVSHPACVRYDTYDYLLAQGWTVHDMVLASVELSTDNIGSYDGSADDIDHWVRLREKSLPFFVAVTCCGALVGQWALTLITAGEYQSLLRGRLEEHAIVGDRYAGPGEYIGYISTMSLRHDFRRQRFLRRLLDTVARLMRAQFDQGVRLSHIGANAYTDAGVQLCRLFGLEYVTEHRIQGSVFAGEERQILGSRLLRRAAV